MGAGVGVLAVVGVQASIHQAELSGDVVLLSFEDGERDCVGVVGLHESVLLVLQPVAVGGELAEFIGFGGHEAVELVVHLGRFGGRQGLIDAVVDDLVAERIDGILAEFDAIDDPAEAFETYLVRICMMQFHEPAANDVLLRTIPESERIEALCQRSSAVGTRLLAAAQSAGAIRQDVTPEDLFFLIWERGVIARACGGQSRDSYLRRTRQTIDGIRG